ncbi:hypothetical protein AKN90_02780 [Thiopseudomonas alkaliphila]|uniref:DUF523 and DUF1722 domain-containing protein n=1 Tax=Thiopseudomonas alkaliphila TaxID=1697053 RepID=UPI00069F6D7F|nr:DUF523 and DUF1722 domain-containing protein [Thiopseudomonas alkaliphila]AKX54751.1 hypothetical protein AKN90_02780 [Thiopseudomonas alkaliphila]
MPAQPPNPRISLAISSCLTGAKVRYNAAHKYSALCMEHLQPWIEWLPLCPEMAIGLGTPRPPIQQQQPSAKAITALDVVNVQTPSISHGVALQHYAQQVAQQLQQHAVAGYVLMQKSPSCALSSSTIFYPQGQLSAQPGFFIRCLQQHLPLLPMIEQQQLEQPELQLHFFYRVQCYYQWQQLIQQPLQPAALYHFHSCYKYLLMARDPACYKRLGQQLAMAAKQPLSGEFLAHYIHQLLQALALPAQRGREYNALLHIKGYLKQLTASETQQLDTALSAFQQQQQTLPQVLLLFQQLLARYPQPYLQQQVLLFPWLPLLS